VRACFEKRSDGSPRHMPQLPRAISPSSCVRDQRASPLHAEGARRREERVGEGSEEGGAQTL
jgi:hypothetical protein